MTCISFDIFFEKKNKTKKRGAYSASYRRNNNTSKHAIISMRSSESRQTANIVYFVCVSARVQTANISFNFLLFQTEFFVVTQKNGFPLFSPIVGSQCGSRIAGNLHNWSHIFIVVSTQQKFKKKSNFYTFVPTQFGLLCKNSIRFLCTKKNAQSNFYRASKNVIFPKTHVLKRSPIATAKKMIKTRKKCLFLATSISYLCTHCHQNIIAPTHTPR